jgi:nitrile hydratase subunit beta
MNGGQDLGGMMGFGAVDREPDEPYFHADWERRAFGITMAILVTGAFTLDTTRHARERLHPVDYLGSTYYEMWTKALEKLLVEHDLVTGEELRAGRALTEPATLPRVGGREQVAAMIARGTPYERPAQEPSRFGVGDRVVARNMHPTGHTRLPRYARGKRGVIDRRHGVFVLPDANAHGEGERPEWLYTVRFSGRELWGEEADPMLSVSIDAWESYLEPG